MDRRPTGKREAGRKAASRAAASPAMSSRRSRARALAGYLGREVADVPIARVAREVDRDPSTLWRDVEWLEGEMKRDREVRSEISRLASACAAVISART